MKASDIMTKEVVTIASSATVAEAITLMKSRGWRSLIVERDHEQDAYGIITETDIVYKVNNPGKDPQQLRVSEVMTKPCIVVNPDLSVEHVIRLFASNHLLRAPVIQGKLLGIISISDILVKSNVSERLEEVLPTQKLPALVQQVRSTCAKECSHSEGCASVWDDLEDRLLTLSQQDSEAVLKTALAEYFADHAELRDPKVLDILCSG